MPGNTLIIGELLLPGQWLISKNGKYGMLIHQNDGNLVVYDRSTVPASPVFSFGMAGHAPGQLVMQGDGNLVLYDNVGQAIWNSGTFFPTRRGVSAILQDDGNFVLYGMSPLFQTQGHPSGTPPAPPAAATGENGIDLKTVAEIANDVWQIVAALI